MFIFKVNNNYHCFKTLKTTKEVRKYWVKKLTEKNVSRIIEYIPVKTHRKIINAISY